MITILFLLFCVSNGSSATIPLLSTPGDVLARTTSTLPQLGAPVDICPNQRSIWDIIQSCLATIFACTWVSVHPDIPIPDDKWWKVTLRRAEHVVWSLLVPELVMLWAMRQWFGARKIAKEQKDKGWNEIHGHFIQMGGFMLYDEHQELGTLSYDRFTMLLANDQIDFPTITREEIKDRSKSDGLAKLLVIGQTGWFILQCITRRIDRLPITELELVTLAFAALNGCMYFFWWNKPFDVRTSVPVILRREKLDDPDVETSVVKSDDIASSEEDEVDILGKHDSALELTEDLHSRARGPIPCQRSTWIPVTAGPWAILQMILERMHTIMVDDAFTQFDNPARPRVPTFYSLDGEDRASLVTVCVIGSIFGAIHCAGWFFDFPTVAELWIWRIASIYIAIYPTFTLAAGFISITSEEDSKSLILRGISITAKIVLVLSAFLGPCFYFTARFLLMAESLATLRELPSEAYAVVQWAIRIPHI